MTASRTWILAIVGLLAANVVAMAILAVLAHHGTSQVIPDYYAKAAHYDDEMARSAASQALGWQVRVTIVDGSTYVTVSDAAGRPLDGAQVRVTGYHRAHAAALLDQVLVPGGPGHYRADSHARPGWYDLTALVTAGGARYTQHVVVEAR
jgi:nitrogen fixation protein FixH